MNKKLRSYNWFYGSYETGLLHKNALRSAGINMDEYKGQPVIGIANTWSELNSCNMSLRVIADEVKKGIHAAGGIAVEFPVMSLGEELMKPTAMLYRNLLSMEVEEHLRAYPIDGIVLLGNCDKTIPGLVMGAISANLPTIYLNAGPKKVGVCKNQRLGSGTDLWKYWEALRNGNITNNEWEEIGKALSCGVGSCNTMGTASTMNAIMEMLGLMPLGLSTMPVDAPERFELSKHARERIVSMVHEELKPSDILTQASFSNAVVLCFALGGSTNAIIHLTAMAGRRCISIYPTVFDKLADVVPCIANVQPSGEKLIDEFHEAGGIPEVMNRLKDVIDLSQKNYTGKSFDALLKSFKPNNKTDAIKTLYAPLKKAPTLVIVKGNLAPSGAVIKVSAASPELLQHTGKAVVFDDYKTMLPAVEDENFDVTKSDILILRNVGPKGAPGMPEWGMIPIPKKLQLQGVKDMIRISDARMSGTSFGTVVLHVCPEAAVGAALALVKNGDMITLNIAEKTLHLHVSDEELNERKKEWKPVQQIHTRGYPSLYINEILQADEGCDFRFLKPSSEKELKFIEPVVGRS